MTVSTLNFEQIVSHLQPSQSVTSRMRAIFGLKALSTDVSVKVLEKSLLTDPSALVRHEVAYVLGQMKAEAAIPTLEGVLRDTKEDVMVRHEAGEALGAIGDDRALPILQQYSQEYDEETKETIPIEIQETCLLAIGRIADCQRYSNNNDNKFRTIDPVLHHNEHDHETLGELKNAVCHSCLPLSKKYRAMFKLRDNGSALAVQALCCALELDKDSALFRHELAYVLGQMAHPDATQSLGRILAKSEEAPMVRHEAAEALGSIATKEAEDILKKYWKDDADVVRESVHVALDISEYVGSNDLDYADTLPKTQ